MFLFLLIPGIFSVIFVSISITFGIYDHIKNLEQLLSSSITFASILLGFLSTLLGILITIRNSPIMKELYRLGFRRSIKYLFYEAIIAGFTVVILSMILQAYSIKFIFYMWLFTVIVFIVSAFRLISTLMRIMFKSDIDEEDEESGRGNPEEKSTVSDLPMVDEERKNRRTMGQTAIYDK